MGVVINFKGAEGSKGLCFNLIRCVDIKIYRMVLKLASKGYLINWLN